MLPSTALGFSFRQADASPSQVLAISAFWASILGGTVSLSLSQFFGTKTKDVGKLRGVTS
ncbi:hypothetical protein SLEP1_g34435 [Rubroshorea leprosula]|uniref:Uncharacterized protein n=1 Tax=Rubroshorea leprosula TaxID=152421 RepID=A0AAV5KK75_9ROSI|nr:hypothetical protein SLEP1_g34435 [Rubroshorea leprosula]